MFVHVRGGWGAEWDFGGPSRTNTQGDLSGR